jgi:tetratricopeptide (TPR) repeat protein
MARQQGQLIEAELACEDAIELFREAEDEVGIATALGELGAILQRQGELQRSETALNEAVTMLRELDDPERLSFTLVALGALHHIQERFDDAADCYRECLEIGQVRQDQHAIATALVNLGEIAQIKNENVEARDLYAQSLSIFNQLDMDITIAYCLEVIAGIDIAEGEAQRAAQLFGAAELLREEIGTPVESFNQERYKSDLAAVQAALDATAFYTARTAGRNLSRAEVVTLALGSEAKLDAATTSQAETSPQ